MPELPELEAAARLMSAAVGGAQVAYARAPGLATMRTYAPPLDSLVGGVLDSLSRRGKLLQLHFSGSQLEQPLTLVIHLMASGRLQLYEAKATLKDRTVRIAIGLEAGADGFQGPRELRLREFGTKQAAWGKLLPTAELDSDETISSLGPDAWPQPPDLATMPKTRPLRGVLRDQRLIAGIGRSWADEILWTAKLAPLRRFGDLSAQELEKLRTTISEVLGAAVSHYDETLSLPVPDKWPIPLQIHRHAGKPCPRCGDEILAVHYESDEMAYCPGCQTGGKPYKDRRMSRLLKE